MSAPVVLTDDQRTAGVDAIRRIIREYDLSDHALWEMGEDGDSEAALLIVQAVAEALADG